MKQQTNFLSRNRVVARLYGIFFISAFLSYGVGSGMVESIADGAEGLAGIAANRTVFTIGIILMAVVHTFVNIGLVVLMLPILKPFNKTVAYGYFGAAVAATVVAIFGAMFMALLLPLSEALLNAEGVTEYFETQALLLKKGGFYGYQIGMTLWGLGGLLFVYLLYISKLVPRVLPVWGGIGYLVFITGTTLELFGFGVGVMLSAPGGLFEIALSLWLIFNGFSRSNEHTAISSLQLTGKENALTIS